MWHRKVSTQKRSKVIIIQIDKYCTFKNFLKSSFMKILLSISFVRFRAASLHQGDHKFLAVSATKSTATATHTNMADQCKSKSGCEARLHFFKGLCCAFVLYTVSAKKLNLSKLLASKIFANCVHTDKGLCQGKLIMENSSKKTC